MSLKHFHLLFIFLAIVVSLFFGIWATQAAMNRAHPSYYLMGGLSFCVGIFLIFYSVQFLKKIRGLDKNVYKN